MQNAQKMSLVDLITKLRIRGYTIKVKNHQAQSVKYSIIIILFDTLT